MRPLKVTVIGDPNVGKTCMMVSYVHDGFPSEHIPTVFDNYSTSLEVDGVKYEVSLWDTAGQEDYERLRLLSYPNTDVFLLCFAINSRTSFNNISLKWIPELKHHSPAARFILVGTKSDLRGNQQSSTVSYSEASKLRRKIGASKYIECSAKNRTSLNPILLSAVRLAVTPARRVAAPRCQFV